MIGSQGTAGGDGMNVRTARYIVISIAALALVGASAAPRTGAADVVGTALALAATVQQQSPGSIDVVRSYRMTISARGFGHMVDIQDGRGRDKFTYTRDGKTSDIYLTKGALYTRESGGEWIMMALPKITGAARPAPHSQTASIASSGDRTLPDRTVNGVLMGAVNTPVPPDFRSTERSAKVMTCLYEKASGLFRSCSAGNDFTITFDRYNDPSNTFTIPSAALRAPNLLAPAR